MAKPFKMKIKVKAKEKKGIVKAKMLIKHPMESGMRKDEDGKLIPIHHLKEVKVEYNGEIIFEGEFGTGVSKDPFVAFSFKGTKGDKIKTSAVDSKGLTDESEITIK
jgi:sulfur-oxidizing protein SoxZ